MKILIYDNNQQDMEKFCDLIKAISFDLQIDKLSDYKDFETIYLKENYDVVFIDTNDNNGKELLKFVKNYNPKQKLVILNNQFDCTEEKGCEYCQNKYHKTRLIKPLNVADIAYALKDKSCKDYCNENDLILKLLVISKSFSNLNFDKENLKFTHKIYQNNIFTSQLINFTHQLSLNNIKFKVYEDHIQILNPTEI